MSKTNLLLRLGRLDSHHRLVIALSIVLITHFLLPEHLGWSTKIVLDWIAFAVCLLLLIWISFFTVHPRQLPQLAQLQDSSRTFLFFLVLGAAIASLWALIALITSGKGLRQSEVSQLVVLSGTAVVCSWLLVHSLFALRYAHLYYVSTPRKALISPKRSNPTTLTSFIFHSSSA